MTLGAYQKGPLAVLRNPRRAADYPIGDFGDLAVRLTALERERLQRQAQDAGIALSRKLYEGWRLTKLLALLPRTFATGDPDLLSRLVAEFWGAAPPRTLYFESEAVEFTRKVCRESPPGTLLHDVAVLEEALLSSAVCGPRAGPRTTIVRLSRDPRDLKFGATTEPRSGEAFEATIWFNKTGVQLSVRRVRP